MTLEEIISAVATKEGAFGLAFVIAAAAFYKYIAPAWGRNLRARQAENATKAVIELNGRLIEAVKQALRPLIAETVREVFKEMPEFIRDRIKGLGEGSAERAIAAWAEKHRIIERLGSVEFWKVDHDKDADLREERIRVMELAQVRLEQVHKGQGEIQERLSEVLDGIRGIRRD